MNNYLIEGNDYIVVKKKIDEVILKHDFNDCTVSLYDMNEDLIDACLEDLDTYGLFSEKKVVILKNVSKICNEENKKSIDHLINYLKNPMSDTLLFIVDSSLDERKKITKTLRSYAEVIKAEINSVDYIKSLLKDYKLESGVIKTINEYCLDDITRITNECEKLKMYKLDEMSITIDDVHNLCIKKLGDTTNLSFELIKAIARKDKKNALSVYNDLTLAGVDAISLVGLIASQIRIMYQVKTLKSKNYSDREIAQMLGEKSSYRITKTKELISYYSEEELLKLLEKLADIDLKMKTSTSDSRLLIELFIFNL